ncbi:MAG: hypothetical protein K5839_05270, partial [Treponemataceae bacterium]|nr:hypothetical protein [Treponemataceae bacterium]
MKEYKSPKNFKAIENTILDTIKIGELDQKLAGFQIKDAWINPGGWQSWSPCFEIEKNKKQAGPKDCILKAMGNLLEFPQTKFKASKNLVLAQFVSYLRWQIDGKDLYLFFASLGSNDEENLCPPVQYIFDRKNNRVTIEIADKGKDWKSGELMARIEIFTSDDYFKAKDILKKLFDLGQFDDLKFLSKNFPQDAILGWESWYNHYTKIDEKI